MREMVRSAIEALRAQPLALTVVLINLMSLVALAFIFREIANATERKDAIIEKCLQQK